MTATAEASISVPMVKALDRTWRRKAPFGERGAGASVALTDVAARGRFLRRVVKLVWSTVQP